MISAILIGTLIGFFIGIPPGPVGVSAINFGLFKGSRQGIWFASANGLMDFIYCFFTITATSALASAFQGFRDDYPLLLIAFQATIIFLLIILGVINLRTRKEEFSLSEKVRKRHQNVIHRFEDRGPFLFGAGVALTNLANPSYFGTLAYITLNVHSFNLFVDQFFNNSVFALAFGLGNFLWLALLIRLVRKFKHRLSDIMLMRVRQFAGISFIGFGILLAYRLFAYTNWPESINF